MEHTNISSLSSEGLVAHADIAVLEIGRRSYLIVHAVLKIGGIPISCQSSARGTCSVEHL